MPLYFYSRPIKPPGNKDPLIIISLIKAGQLAVLRGSAGQRSVSGSAAALAAAGISGSGSSSGSSYVLAAAA